MAKKIMREHMKERFANTKEYSDNPPLPTSLNIELNNTCNHKCVFCPFHGELAINKIKPAVMDKKFAKNILDKAAQCGIGSKEVGFYMAGEAFAYEGFSEVVAYAKSLGFEYTFVTTNGALATPKKIDELLNAGIDSIRFSINGSNRDMYRLIHGVDDFDQVLSNVKYLNKKRKDDNYDVAVSISSVVTKKTKENFTEIRNVFEDYVDDIIFIPIIIEYLQELSEIKDEWQIVEDNKVIDSTWVCSMLFDTMYINARGKVMPCCNAYHFDEEFYDLHEDLDLVKAWESDGYRRYRRIFTMNDDDKGTICKNCLLRREGVERLSVEDLI